MRVDLDHLGHLMHLRSLEREPRGIGPVDQVPPAAVLRDEMRWLTEYVEQCDRDTATIAEAQARALEQIEVIRQAVAARRVQALERLAEFDNAARVLELGVRMIDLGGNQVGFIAEDITELRVPGDTRPG